MKRFIVASGAALGSTLVGVANSIIVVRAFTDGAAAAFFQISSLVIMVGVLGEAGLANHAVHDVARLVDVVDRDRYVDAALLEALRRGAVASIVAFVCGKVVFGFGWAICVSAALGTVGIVIAVVGQALSWGTGRSLAGSLGGPVGATLLVGVALVVGWATTSIEPAHLAAAGYAASGLVVVPLLWRPRATRSGRPPAVRLRRTFEIGFSNVLNAAGRQLDVWIAAALLAGAAFNSYALAAKIAATVGVVTYAASQATAPDVHRWVEGDDQARRSVRRIHGLGLVVVVALGATVVAVGPPLGRWVFGEEIVLSRVVLVILLAGYVLWAMSAPARLALIAIERTDIVLKASIAAITAACLAGGVVALSDEHAAAAAAFVLGWLGVLSLATLAAAPALVSNVDQPASRAVKGSS